MNERNCVPVKLYKKHTEVHVNAKDHMWPVDHSLYPRNLEQFLAQHQKTIISDGWMNTMEYTRWMVECVQEAFNKHLLYIRLYAMSWDSEKTMCPV